MFERNTADGKGTTIAVDVCVAANGIHETALRKRIAVM